MTPQSTIQAASAGEDAFRASCIAAAKALGVSQENAEQATDAAIAAGRGIHRVYHDVGHFRELAEGSSQLVEALKQRATDPQLADRLGHLYTLVARDHDVAYIPVDRGLPPAVEKTVSPYLTENAPGVFRIREDVTGENIAIAMAVFGNAPGETLLPFSGQNEFISALHSLEVNKGLCPADKVALALMIQQSIPFLPENALQKAMGRVHALGLLTPAEEHVLGMAGAHFGNRDVRNFAQSRESFFENTIKLMREGGTDFSNPAHIAEKALRTAAFFIGLAADMESGKKTVFRNYGDLLEAEKLPLLNAKAHLQMQDCIADMQAMAVAAHPETAATIAATLNLDLSAVTGNEATRGEALLAQAIQWVNPGASWVDSTKDSSPTANKYR